VNLAALAPLGGAALTIGTCYAAGTLLVSRLGVSLRRSERFPLTFVVGAACIHLLMFAVFLLNILHKPLLLILAAILIASAVWQRENGAREARFSFMQDPSAIGYAAIFVAFSVFYFVTAWAPEASPDGSGYHLELIGRYLDAHGFVPITTNLYAGFGQGAEMLYAMARSFGGHSAAALVHLAFAIALAWAMLAYGFRIGKWWVGAGAALLVYLSPVVGKDASSAYIDMASAAIGFAVFYWLELWDETRDHRTLIPIGVLSGYAYATKYTGGILVLYAIAFVVWRNWKRVRDAWKPLLIVSAGAAAMILPWMIKDWIYLGDPVAPFGAAIFRNPNVHVAMLDDFTEYWRNHGVVHFWELPLGLTIHGGAVEGLLGPAFLAAPIGLLALRYPTGRRLLLAAGVTLIPYAVNVHGRFLIPSLPFISMAIVLPLGNAPQLIAVLVLFHAIASWPTVVPRYAEPTAWRLVHFPLAAALRRETEDGFLRRTLPGYPEARLIEEHVPPGARVLTLSTIASAYTSREILVAYQAALNQVFYDSLTMALELDSQPSAAAEFRFAERSLQRIRILQTAARSWGQNKNQQWGVHEVRYFLHGVEVQRSPAWRLHAWPNPWEVQLAFDGSPATRWRTWETVTPGMYIETDFGGAQTIDEVRVETSREDRKAALKVEAMTLGASGSSPHSQQWMQFGGDPEYREIPIRQSLRRAATYEMRAKGVEYLLIQDRDFGAADFEEDPASWNLAIAGRTPHATLYKVMP
jgi:hypothetical protein